MVACEKMNNARMHVQAKLACTETIRPKGKLRLESAKRPKSHNYNWGTGSSSTSQWQQHSSHADTSTDQAVTGFMETHNKFINRLAPVGGQPTRQPPVTPITPITPVPLLEPETLVVQQQSPPVLSGIVYFYGKGVDQTGQAHFVRSVDWTGPRQAELPAFRDVLNVHHQKDDWNGEHWNKQVGPHVAVAVADVKWLVTVMIIHQSFVDEGVGNVTRKTGS